VSKKAGIDLVVAKDALERAAKAVLTPEELKDTKVTIEGDLWVSFKAPSKSELLASLTDGDGDAFVQRIVSSFKLMARLLPALK
jgi:hypothetical protein